MANTAPNPKPKRSTQRKARPAAPKQGVATKSAKKGAEKRPDILAILAPSPALDGLHPEEAKVAQSQYLNSAAFELELIHSAADRFQRMHTKTGDASFTSREQCRYALWMVRHLQQLRGLLDAGSNTLLKIPADLPAEIAEGIAGKKQIAIWRAEVSPAISALLQSCKQFSQQHSKTLDNSYGGKAKADASVSRDAALRSMVQSLKVQK